MEVKNDQEFVIDLEDPQTSEAETETSTFITRNLRGEERKEENEALGETTEIESPLGIRVLWRRVIGRRASGDWFFEQLVEGLELQVAGYRFQRQVITGGREDIVGSRAPDVGGNSQRNFSPTIPTKYMM